MSGLSTSSKSAVDEAKSLASDIADSTRLSEKQATALLMREVLNKKDKEIAEVLDVAPASTSSYISTCREKFNSVDEEISDLEDRIDKWERTNQLQGIVSGCSSFDELRNRVESEIIRDEDVKYAVSYIDNSGAEDLLLTEESPQDLDVQVLEYKRVSSVKEVFE